MGAKVVYWYGGQEHATEGGDTARISSLLASLARFRDEQQPGPERRRFGAVLRRRLPMQRAGDLLVPSPFGDRLRWARRFNRHFRGTTQPR